MFNDGDDVGQFWIKAAKAANTATYPPEALWQPWQCWQPWQPCPPNDENHRRSHGGEWTLSAVTHLLSGLWKRLAINVIY
jgi:hypothetical protein